MERDNLYEGGLKLMHDPACLDEECFTKKEGEGGLRRGERRHKSSNVDLKSQCVRNWRYRVLSYDRNSFSWYRYLYVLASLQGRGRIPAGYFGMA